MDTSINEKEVTLAVKKGDTEAFAALVLAHQARVRFLCLGFLRNREEADDAAQDIFIKAFQALGQFKEEASFGTWVGRIAANHCRDLWRQKARQPTESLDTLIENEGEAFQQLFDPSRSASPPTNTPEELELLGRLLASLPEEEREILTLSEVEQLSYAAMAARLQCSLDAVKGRLKRARQHVQEKCRTFF